MIENALVRIDLHFRSQHHETLIHKSESEGSPTGFWVLASICEKGEIVENEEDVCSVSEKKGSDVEKAVISVFQVWKWLQKQKKINIVILF